MIDTAAMWRARSESLVAAIIVSIICCLFGAISLISYAKIVIKHQINKYFSAVFAIIGLNIGFLIPISYVCCQK